MTLQPSDDASSLLEAPLRDWYQWRNGQHCEEENLFLEMHRFYSIEDAQRLLEITQRLSIRAEHHWPLLTDNAGEGYYFSTFSGSVLYNASEFYNREDQLFASFELFMDFLMSWLCVNAQQ